MEFADIHCHILWGVDDGSKSEEETRLMLQSAYEEGITSILATPHYRSEMSSRHLERQEQSYQRICEIAAEISSEMRIYRGAELYYESQVVEDLKQKKAPVLNGGRYVLVEFPVYIDYPYIRAAIQQLRWAGFWPVLAHVERYDCLELKAERIKTLIEMGSLIQTNTDAVIGKQGWMVKRSLYKLMKQGLIHVVATDAHGSKHRRMCMRGCAEYITGKLGEKVCRTLCRENPLKIIRGEKIYEESVY